MDDWAVFLDWEKVGLLQVTCIRAACDLGNGRLKCGATCEVGANSGANLRDGLEQRLAKTTIT
jgi:hypothetical protein